MRTAAPLFFLSAAAASPPPIFLIVDAAAAAAGVDFCTTILLLLRRRRRLCLIGQFVDAIAYGLEQRRLYRRAVPRPPNHRMPSAQVF